MAKAKAAAKAVEEEVKTVTKMADASVPMTVPQGAWGGEEMDNSDILVPKLLLMQGLSQLVSDAKASVGQIRDSLDGNLLGGWDGAKKAAVPVSIIVFHMYKSWVIFEEINGKFEFKSMEPMTPENQGWALEEVVAGVKIRRDKTLNFYCIRPEDVKEGMAFPLLLSCRRTSYKAGRKLSTAFAKLKAFKRPTASKVFSLMVTQQENDKGKYFVYDIEPGRDSTAAEVAEAYKWNQAFKTATVKVDDRDLKAEAAQPSKVAEQEDDIGF